MSAIMEVHLSAGNPRSGNLVNSIVTLFDPLEFEKGHFSGRTVGPREWDDGGKRLKINDSTLQTEHGGVGAVVGAQFGQNVFDPAFDGIFSD
jgi:hypothetical protein